MKTFQTPFLTQMPPSRSCGSRRAGSFSFEVNRGASAPNSPPQVEIGQLTARQKEVLRLIAEGKANKETAAELCISIKTVEKHRQNLMVKLGIHETAGLTHFAIATGVVECRYR